MATVAEVGANPAPLEDLMVAMDVVDTVRHRELIVDRELDAGTRRERLLARLKEIYTAQGIEVTDAALEAGVDALEQERFAYTPTADGFSTTLARIYTRRDRWLKPVVAIAIAGFIAWLAWYLTVGLPKARMQAQLPAAIQSTYQRITSISSSDKATASAKTLLGKAQQAIGLDNYRVAENLHGDMQTLLSDLQTNYEVRIISRPNELSGVWRVPEINSTARNYYLIVEAVADNGSVFPVRVRNEEDGRVGRVTAWGIRVSEETFQAVAADKRDDGIIQNGNVGSKQAGYLEPEYRVSITGGTITSW